VRKDGSLFWANIVLTAVLDHRGDHQPGQRIRPGPAQGGVQDPATRPALIATTDSIGL
jgi:hypothetical protein